MTTVSITRFRDFEESQTPEAGQDINLTLPLSIGRGHIMQCPEKKVSRHHAVLDVDENGVLLTATHSSPVYTSCGKEKRVLKHMESAVLRDGDFFGFLPSLYWYRVNLPHLQSLSKDCSGKEKSTVSENGDLRDESASHKTSLTAEGSQELSSISGIHCGSLDLTEQPSEKVCESVTEVGTEEVQNSNCDDNGSASQIPANENCPDKGTVRMRILPKWLGQSDQDKPVPPVKSPRAGRNKEKHVHGSKPRVPRVLKDQKPGGKGVSFGSTNALGSSPKKVQNLSRHTLSSDESSEEVEVKKAEPRSKESDKAVKKSPKKSPLLYDKTEDTESAKVKHSLSNNGSEGEVRRVLHFPDQSDRGSESVNAEQNSCTGATERRTVCQYKGQCYRKNPDHKKQFSHPGDSDYVSEEEKSDDDERPECEYGLSCYRKNPQHRKQYKHTKKPQPKRAAKRKGQRKKKQKVDDSEDEYDSEDSFINDDSSDDYAPTDSDTDSEPPSSHGSDNNEQESPKRLLKEAKRFVRHKH